MKPNLGNEVLNILLQIQKDIVRRRMERAASWSFEN
jgi:hypothetical protein